jgi:hypothetical protein
MIVGVGIFYAESGRGEYVKSYGKDYPRISSSYQVLEITSFSSYGNTRKRVWNSLIIKWLILSG